MLKEHSMLAKNVFLMFENVSRCKKMKFKYLFVVVMLGFFFGTNSASATEITSDNIIVTNLNKSYDSEVVLLANEGEEEATGTVNYCEGLKPTFVFIGHLIRLAKILIPIVIIIFGMLDFFKAVTGAKDDELRKSLRSLLFRILAGVCIFFLPAVIDFVFSLVDGWSNSEYESNYQNCFKCVWNVSSCTK